MGMRAVLAVPLHASTGMFIGNNLAINAVERKGTPAHRILLLPVLIHGTYDCLLMLALAISREGEAIGLLGLAALLIPFVAFSYIYSKIRKLPEVYHDPRALDYLMDP